MLELLGLCNDDQAALDVAAALGGSAYVQREGEKGEPHYTALIRVATDNIEAVSSVADAGLHVCFPRIIKALEGPTPADRCVATFGLTRNAALTHREADDHWRDTHGPLALRCHTAMCDYTQLSIVATLSGPPLDGVAMCAFATRDDLRTRFFNDDQAKADVIADVATFAAPGASPPRVVLTQRL